MQTENRYRIKPGQVVRLDGMRFGYLVVLGRGARKGKYAAWLCRCDCGIELEINGRYLRRGATRSCNRNGHRFKISREPAITTLYKSEYQSWRSMTERCTDPNHKNYKYYGGRGITIDPRWAEFKNFMLDMGRKSNPKFTIEREDVNGNYEPKNCKWISRADQGRNKRNSVFVTYQGKRILLIDLVEEFGLSRTAVYGRLKGGWTLAQAIALPLRLEKPRRPYIKGGRKKVLAYCKPLAEDRLKASPRIKKV